MAETVHPELLRYVAELADQSAASRPSLFWERQLAAGEATAAVPVAEISPAEAEQVLRASAYGFEALDPGVDVADAPSFLEAFERIGDARKLAKRVAPGKVDLDKDQWEHLRALDFLQRKDWIDAYLEFVRPLGVHSSMSSARHWWYARQIVELARATQGARPLDVIEIGAGAGNLAIFLTRMGIVRSYTIVDLPQMLVHSAYTVQRHVPDADLSFNTAPQGQGSYTFVADFRAAEVLGGGAFDIALNMNSFMEMDRQARDDYIELIYRTARPGALFYNVNRRQPALPLHDGGTWDNNPLLYPYRSDDEILIWEDDPFQTATRSGWGARPMLTVTRAAVIRPT